MGISFGKSISIILACAIVTFLIRYLPFFLFNSDKKEIPKVVLYLGDVLPPAVIAVLVIYCIKDIEFGIAAGFLPQIISIALVVILHIWKKNYLISIAAGTVCFVILTNFVF